jgi:hypothetical protein
VLPGLRCAGLPKVDTKFVSESDEVAPSMTVAFGELIDELLNARGRLGHDLFFSPCLSLTFVLSARSSNSRSGATDGGLRLAPFGLPLWPGLN